jgi:hypothetical protein
MPAKPRSTTSTPRTPRRKAKPTAETCPVLAGFARLKQIEADQAAVIDSQNPQIDSPADHRPSSRSSAGAFALLIALVISVGLVARVSRSLTTDNDAAIAVRTYAHLCDSEIVAALRARNNGQLTGEQAIEIIQQARPVIHRAAWQRLADRLTALQTDDGLMRQAELNHFLDEMHSGLSSF